jgi:protein-arginine kinase
MRASIQLSLPKVGQNKDLLKQIGEQYSVAIRGVVFGQEKIFDISNQQCLGITEKDLIQNLC